MPRRVSHPHRSLPSYDKLLQHIAQLEMENAYFRCATRYLTEQNDEKTCRLSHLISQTKIANKTKWMTPFGGVHIEDSTI